MDYLTRNPIQDRDIYMREGTPPKASSQELRRLIFRNMMIDKRDMEIADILWNYFDAVRSKWPVAWEATGSGQILNKTNGFSALMRFLRPVYLYLVGPGEIPTRDRFASIINRIAMTDAEFTVETFRPGTSGEGALYHAFLSKVGIEAIAKG